MMKRVEYVRPTLVDWNIAVETRLKTNDWKGGWETCGTWTLFDHLLQEIAELERALYEVEATSDPDWTISRLIRVKEEAADVSAMAMMVADVAGVPFHANGRLNGKSQEEDN